MTSSARTTVLAAVITAGLAGLANIATAGTPQIQARLHHGHRDHRVVAPYGSFVRPFGPAEVIRARGEAAVNFSAARINNEVARSLYIENKVKATEALLHRRAIGKAARAEYYARKRAGRQAYLEQRRAEAAARAEAERLAIEEQLAANAGE